MRVVIIKRYLAFLLLVNAVALQAQITGKVFDKETKQTLENVFIRIQETNRWTLSIANGEFIIKNKEYPVHVEFKLLGKKTLVKKVFKATDLTIYLEDDNLKLDEVVVTAQKKKQSTGAEIVLGKQAINLVQAQSLADVLQLIPGKVLSESNLHERQILNLRSAIFSDSNRKNSNQGLGNTNNQFLINNSFGVGYLIDDIPLSVNGDLTGNRANNVNLFSNITEFNSTGYGLDLRTIALDDIESVEIVQGITSAKYGDHNTGLIKIKKAIGYKPLDVNTTLRGGSYGVTLSRGFELAKKNGFLNVSVDYLHSNNDPRKSLASFDRINLSTSWQYRKKGEFSNRLVVNYNQNLSKENAEITSTSERSKRLEARGFRISNTTEWFFNDFIVDNIEWRNSINYQNSTTHSSQLINSGGKPIANSLVEGTFELGYTPPNYRGKEEVNNTPVNFFSQVDFYKSFTTNQLKTIVSGGLSLSIDDNYGKGTIINTDNVQSFAALSGSGGIGWRSINFNDAIPADKKISAYISSKTTTKLFNKDLNVNLGVRYDNYSGLSAISPRFNSSLYLNKQHKLRLGTGFFTKSPALQFLYPGTTYYDYLIADFRTNAYSFALGHTFIRDFQNKNLKPSKTFKIEFGYDYFHPTFTTSINAYYNRQTDGFTSESVFEIANVPTFDFTFYPDRAPDYVQSGEKRVLLGYRQTTNGLTSVNTGIEFLGNTKKISSINTSFSFSVAYRYTKTISNVYGNVFSNDILSPAWIGVHKPVDDIYKTLNSSITAIHHVPNIGLVLTLTAEQFWLSDYKSPGFSVNPIAYYDRNLVYHEIPVSERANDAYIPIRRSGTNSQGAESSQKIIFGNYHLKLSKEFENGLRFSFYAINFLNHRPETTITDSFTGEPKRRIYNRPVSFGGTIRYKF